MKRLILDLVLLALVLAAGAAAWFWSWAVSPAPGPAGEVVVTIPKGAGMTGITAVLARAGLVPPDRRLALLARLTGQAGRLKAGEYRISGQPTPLELLDILERGQSVQHLVTLPEGRTLAEFAAILAADGWVEEERFLALCQDAAFIRSLGLDTESLEGYLFPDTYALVRGKDHTVEVLRRLHARFEQVWEEIAAPAPLDLDRASVVVLASVVEKETADPAERPLIARVFLNRLERNMPLQSDPTVIYGIEDFDGNLTRAHLRRDHPWNTYTRRGLPATPICNPGRAALEAVLHPATGRALYFVSRNDGTHHFSTTLAEHNRAVRRYQKNRKNRKSREDRGRAVPEHKE